MSTVTPERLALAREVKRLREKGLLWREIAKLLGISRSYADALYHDPDGARARERKNRYRLPCPKCGTLMDGSGGRTGAPSRCASCAAEEGHAAQHWTRERIVEAVQAWAAEHGRPPKAMDWVRSGVTKSGVRYPACTNTYRAGASTPNAPFAQWGDVIEAAGFKRPRRGDYVRTPEHRARLSENRRVYSDDDVLAQLRAVAVALGRVPRVKKDISFGLQALMITRFGSVARAYELAGLPPPRKGRQQDRPLPDGFTSNGAS